MPLKNAKLVHESPRLLSGASGWVEHIPFAFALIELLRPATLVELGAYAGDSYCAFCQAVDALALQTQCTAIDTWQGDPHCGFYGPQVLGNLRRHHDPFYARFSRLLQSTFDDAVVQFADQSIDLLHLDGLHALDSARHDFDLWLPKMSAQGVVLLHDTRVKRNGFGVWKLWAELSQRYPSFEFHHGFGLGVLGVGSQPSSAMLELFAIAQKDAASMRRHFSTLGRRVTLSPRNLLAQARHRAWRAARKWTAAPADTPTRSP